MEEISHDHGDLMAEERVDSRHSATQRRVIDGVVVDERGEMNQLQSRGEHHRLILSRFPLPASLPLLDLTRQQQQRRTEQFAAHGKQMRANLSDQWEIAVDNARHRSRHVVELATYGKLNRLERDPTRHRHLDSPCVRGCGRAHFVAALVICLRRLLTSRKSMSIANTRW